MRRKNVHELAANYDAIYRGERPAGRYYRDDEIMLLCFTHYRSRCIKHAAAAFAAEAETRGPLTQRHLFGSEMPAVLTGEMAAALASWLPAGSPKRAAATAVADALRGSYWLWLEDDIRAMTTLRVVLEQGARLRVWRLKPQHARKLEVQGTPSRWLEKAGWGRLASLNRVLGEMIHFRANVKWGAAFHLLVMLNPTMTAEEAPFTARRHALEAVTRLIGREIREQVRHLDPRVGDAFDHIALEIFAGGPDVDDRLDQYLNHAHGLRSVLFPSEHEGWSPIASP